MGKRYFNAKDTVPYSGAAAVVPSDSVLLPLLTTRGLYVGGAGSLAVQMADGMTVTFPAVAVGVLPLQVDKVLATGTTATNLLALY